MGRSEESIIRSLSGRELLGPLAKVGWLADQPPPLIEWVGNSGQLHRVASGEHVYRAGDPPKGIYGLRSGHIEIEFPLIGDEPVSLLRTNEGFWIGDSALLSKSARLVSVIAVQDCTLVFLANEDIRDLLERSPEHWHSFYDLSHRNTQTALSLLAEALSLSVRARVCRMLLHLSEGRVEAHITQDALAKTLGIARPTLRRCLSDLTERGAIENKYRRIAIRDRAALETFRNEQ